jgi:hypothetical protein
VKVTLAPGQIVVAEAETLTDGVVYEVTVTATGPRYAVHPNASVVVSVTFCVVVIDVVAAVAPLDHE